jgi:hypothetical protein
MNPAAPDSYFQIMGVGIFEESGGFFGSAGPDNRTRYLPIQAGGLQLRLVRAYSVLTRDFPQSLY